MSEFTNEIGVSDMLLAKQIAVDAAEAVVAEEEEKKKTLLIVLICVGVAAVAAIAAAAVILATKNKDGERRGKVVLMKIKEKLPAKKKKENMCEELAEDECEFEEI